MEGTLQPLLNLLLVLVVNKSKHQQHDAQGHEAEDAVKQLKFPDVDHHHSSHTERQNAEAEPAIDALAQSNSGSEKDQCQRGVTGGKISPLVADLLRDLRNPIRDKK